MQLIPPAHRKLIDSDPYYKMSCLSKARGTFADRIVIHHAWEYAGKQISEMWNYCPLLESEHSPYSQGKSVHNSKRVNDEVKLIAIGHAGLDYLKINFPKKDWELELRKIKFNLKLI
jgi:hypothetical protein